MEKQEYKQVYFCYLLKSVATPRSKATYIGFTSHPHRRLRQHNGDIVSGAYRTSRFRPWVHVVIVGGFPNKITALQFEWQWQHPHLSRITSEKAKQCKITKKSRDTKAKLQALNLLVSSPLWSQLRLSIFINQEQCTWNKMMTSQYFPSNHCSLQYTTTSEIESLHLSCRSFSTICEYSLDSVVFSCSICQQFENRRTTSEDTKACETHWICNHCHSVCHLACSALQYSHELIPYHVSCVMCGTEFPWVLIIRTMLFKQQHPTTRELSGKKRKLDQDTVSSDSESENSELFNENDCDDNPDDKNGENIVEEEEEIEEQEGDVISIKSVSSSNEGGNG